MRASEPANAVDATAGAARAASAARATRAKTAPSEAQRLEQALRRAQADAAVAHAWSQRRIANTGPCADAARYLTSSPARPQEGHYDEACEAAFNQEMVYNALDYEIHDEDSDNNLDFREFCALVRKREYGWHSERELKTRFKELDLDGSGKIDMNEYICWSLRDAMIRSAARVLDLFRLWDKDGSGHITKRDFRRGIRALGFDFVADDQPVDTVFDRLDVDGSGTIEYQELYTALHPPVAPPSPAGGAVTVGMGAQGGVATSHAPKLRKPRGKGVVLPTTVRLNANAWSSVQQQIKHALQKHAVRVVDIFRDWDENNDGKVSKHEFARALQALGYEAPRSDVYAVFAEFDADNSGTIEYGELKRQLEHRVSVVQRVMPGSETNS